VVSLILRTDSRIATLFQVYFTCVVPRVVLGALRVQHKPTHLSTPVSPCKTSCQLAHWHACCTACKTRANFGRASCWHECCTACKTHANSGPGTNVATQAKPMPTLRPSKTRANFRHAKVVPMLGRGRGLTCVDNCSSHSGTKKVKTSKKDP
jgi:hypothetical protein